MEQRIAALVLGIGNVLWADEGFGVRAVEALHAAFDVSRRRRAAGRRHAGPRPVRRGRVGAARAGVRRHRLRARPAARSRCCATTRCRRGARRSSRRTRPASTTCWRWRDSTALRPERDHRRSACSRSSSSDFGGSLRAAGARAPRRGRRARRAASWPPGARRPRRAPTARPSPPLNAAALALDAYEARPAVRGRTPAASATRGCWRRAPRATGELTCASASPCDGRRARRRDRRLRRAAAARERHQRAAGRRPPPRHLGARVPGQRGARARRRRGGADRRRARRAGRRCSPAAPTSTRYFADLVDREPQLPAHLQGTAA